MPPPTKEPTPQPGKGTQTTVLGLLKDYWIVIVSTSVFVTSTFGYIQEYFLLRNFGINIVIFASIDDFILAGLKDTRLFIHINGLIIYLASSHFYARIKPQLERELKLSRDRADSIIDYQEQNAVKHREGPFIIKIRNLPIKINIKLLKFSRDVYGFFFNPKFRPYILVLVVIGVATTFYESTNVQANLIRSPVGTTSEVLLRTGGLLAANHTNGVLKFISATDKYVFFYHTGNSNTYTVPSASITSIKQSPSRASTTTSERNTIASTAPEPLDQQTSKSTLQAPSPQINQPE